MGISASSLQYAFLLFIYELVVKASVSALPFDHNCHVQDFVDGGYFHCNID
jgi:hypothetical protein